MSTLLAVGTGCVLASMSTQVDPSEVGWTDRTRAEIVAREGCTHIDVVLPPGAQLSSWKAKVKLADGGGHRLEATRAEWWPRDLSGVRRVRVHVPELLTGDRVRLDVRRSLAAGPYDWSPGEDGALFAELAHGRDRVRSTVRLGGNAKQAWMNEPDPLAHARLYASEADRDADTLWLLLDPKATPPQGAGTQTPSEVLGPLSRRRLVPERTDLAPLPDEAGTTRESAVAQTLIDATPLQAGVLRQADGSRPRGLVAAAPRVAGRPLRVWAHPEQAWPDDGVVSLDGLAEAPVGAPAGPGPTAEDAVRIDRLLQLQLPAGGDPRVALVPGAGSTWVRTDTVRFVGDRGTARLRLITAPPGAQVQAEVQSRAAHSRALVPSTADQVLLVAAPGEDPSFLVSVTGLDAPTCGSAASGEVERFSVEGAGATLQNDASGWWLSRWSGVELASERARVVAGLYGRFNRRSLPEPGLPLRMRSRFRGWDLAAELPDALRQRAVVAELPGQSPLWPRKLYRARGSGIVTPVEAALIIRAYALQSRMDAEWVLVRSLGAPDGPELCAPTYDAMLVRLRYDGEERWLDPACEACAPFEIRPELLGQPALGPGAERSPDPVPGSWQITVQDRSVTWSLDGPAALELRRWLRALPVEGRATALAERMAGPGARLDQVVGAKERGVPVKATATAASSTALPDPVAQLLPPTGTLIGWSGPRKLMLEGTSAVTLDLPRGTLQESARERALQSLATGTEP